MKFHARTPLDWLTRNCPEARADVCIALHPDATLPFRDIAGNRQQQSPLSDAHGRPFFCLEHLLEGAFLRLRFDDGAEFVIDRQGTRVFGSWGPGLCQADAEVYLFGLVSGLLLRLRGATALHASAVVIAGQAVAFLGTAGLGKSTAAAAFALRGHPVITDNIAALRERAGAVFVQPGAPRVLLWPPSVEALWHSPEALPRLLSTWDKRYLDLREHGRYCSEETRLRAIYVLDDWALNGQFSFEPMRGTDALRCLVGNTYANYLLDAEQRAADFALLSRVARGVPVVRLRRPEDRSRLDALCEAVTGDFERRCGADRENAHV